MRNPRLRQSDGGSPEPTANRRGTDPDATTAPHDTPVTLAAAGRALPTAQPSGHLPVSTTPWSPCTNRFGTYAAWLNPVLGDTRIAYARECATLGHQPIWAGFVGDLSLLGRGQAAARGPTIAPVIINVMTSAHQSGTREPKRAPPTG
jgi:hypothetical protein